MTEQDLLGDYIEKNAHVNGIRLTYFERGIVHRGKKPTLLFVHATGFHARVWDRLVRQFPDYHVISVDQRGHGRSEKKYIEHWDQVIGDLAELIIQLDLLRVVGIGHSMGGHALIGAASQMQERFQCIVALDPVIPAEDAYAEDMPSAFDTPGEHPTAKRRREFDSPEEMADRLRPKGSYGLFEPDMLMDYCKYGLLPNEAGKGYVLACPPDIEASVYMSSRSNHGIYEAVRNLAIPVVVARAKEPESHGIMDFSSSPTWPGLAGEFQNARDVHYADKTHFLPMQIPEEIVRLINEEIELSSNE